MNQINAQLKETGGILQFKTPGHSILSATHPTVYKYFKCSVNQTKTGKFSWLKLDSCCTTSGYVPTAWGGLKQSISNTIGIILHY